MLKAVQVYRPFQDAYGQIAAGSLEQRHHCSLSACCLRCWQEASLRFKVHLLHKIYSLDLLQQS